jgi:hypothetical protein
MPAQSREQILRYSFAALVMIMWYNLRMRTFTCLLTCLLIAVLAIFPGTGASAQDSNTIDRLDSVVITFDPPIVKRCNRASDLYNLIVATVKSPKFGIEEQISQSGSMWSASHSLCGVQFSLLHFDDPAKAAGICKKLLAALQAEMPAILQKDRHSNEFADYLHDLLYSTEQAKNSLHKPVSVALTRNLAAHTAELHMAAATLASVYSGMSNGDQGSNTLPGVLPTVYTVFAWPEASIQAFFTAKYLGEKFIREAGLDSQLKYEIIYGDATLKLVVYLSGNEEQLAESMAKFRQIENFRLGRDAPADWQAFSLSMSEIMADDQRDLGKRAMFSGWLQHWRSSIDNDDPVVKAIFPVHPEHKPAEICMPESFQHHLSFSSGFFPDFAAGRQSDGGNICDITIAIGGDNRSMIKEIHQDLKDRSFSMMPLTLTLDHGLLKVVFSCAAEEVSGNLARLRNHIYNNLVEKGLISEPIDTLKIGIAGVSSLPPFELRGLLQKGWSPISDGRQTNELSNYAELPGMQKAGKESLKQRWQLYLASSRGRSELLAIIAASGSQIKNFDLPQQP